MKAFLLRYYQGCIHSYSNYVLGHIMNSLFDIIAIQSCKAKYIFKHHLLEKIHSISQNKIRSHTDNIYCQ